MLSSDIMRGYNDVLILEILKKGDSYGYVIGKDIALKSNNDYVIKEATIYSVLIRLEKKKYVESYKGKVSRGNERTYFKITKEGIEFLKERYKEWKKTKRVLDNFMAEED